jgi:hypothetical protein
LNGREKVVEKNWVFPLLFCQIVALMLPHRSVFAGLLLVAILFPPWLKWSWLSHRKRRANAHFTEETWGRGRGRRAGEEEAAGVTVLLARAVRLVGESRSASAGGYRNNTMGCIGGELSARWLRVAEDQLFEQLDVAKVSPFIFEKHELAGLLLIPLRLLNSVVCEDF